MLGDARPLCRHGTMVFVIVRVSYDPSREAPPLGEVCGTAFFIDAHAALAACQVLSRATYGPHAGYEACASDLARASFTHTCRIDGKRPFLGARARGSWAWSPGEAVHAR